MSKLGYLTIYLWQGAPAIVPIHMEDEHSVGQAVEKAIRSRSELRLVYRNNPEVTCFMMHGSLIAGFRVGDTPGWEAPKLNQPKAPPKEEGPRSDVNDADWWKQPDPKNPFDPEETDDGEPK